MVGAGHFESHADVYAAARPPYPEALWQRIRELGALRAGDRAVDLGAGTGQATGPLLKAGLQVTAVEPGPRLAAQLRDSYPGATVLTVRAEQAPLPAASVDLAVAATAIHWMDLDVLLPLLHRALTPEGWLLVWRNVFGDPDAAPTPFRERVAEIVARRSAPPRPGSPEDLATTCDALSRSGLFTVVSTDRFRWSWEIDADGVDRLFSTFSDWSPPEVREAADAVRALGGSVVEHYGSWLIALRPVATR